MRLTRTFLLGATIALSGCVSLLPEPAPADVVYRLSATSEGVPQSQTAKVIRIDRPRAASVFQGKDVVVSPDGRRLASASQAKWAESIPDMIQNSFVDVLAERAGLVGVTVRLWRLFIMLRLYPMRPTVTFWGLSTLGKR